MATLSDIAKAAGCSVNLVSYVLHKETPPTKERHKEILRIAEEMNYVSNRVASALVTGQTNNLSLIICSDYYATLSSPFFSELLYELTKQLSMEGIGLTLYASEGDPLMAHRVVLDGISDGVMWYMGCPPVEIQQQIKKRGLPELCLYISKSSVPNLEENISFLTIDDYTSEYQLMQYLYDQNHRHMVFVGNRASFRYAAYRDFCVDHQLPVLPELHAVGNTDFKNRRALEGYIRQYGSKFTAMVCCTDEVAISMLYVLNSMGFRVPQDVSVVGYDNLPDTANCTPAMTTVQQNHNELARQATNFFCAAFEINR